MTLEEAIKARHSVRNYKHQPLSEEQIRVLQHKIDECNTLSNLHIQLVTNETKAFSGIMSYGVFSRGPGGEHQKKAHHLCRLLNLSDPD